MSNVEITHQSWFSRIKNAIGGVFFGILLVIAAIYMLGWNEKSAVQRALALKEGSGSVLSVDASGINAQNEGKLVHVSGMATTSETLRDADFAISIPQSIKIRRNVKIYQWDEEKHTKTKKTTGGGSRTETTYSYHKTWSDKPISSSGFHKGGHTNTGSMIYAATTINAQKVTLGAFTLPQALMDRLSNYEALPLSQEHLASLPPGLKGRIHLSGNEFYYGKNPGDPRIGDLKISFQVLKPCEVSIIARQAGDSFSPYETKGGQLLELKNGSVSASEMFKQAQEENVTTLWILRGVGFIMIWIGLALVFRPVSVLADVIPFFGNLAEAGLGLLAFVLAIPLCLVTVGVSWLAARPLVGIVLIVLTAVAVLCAVSLVAGKRQSR